MENNILTPQLFEVENIVHETEDVFTLTLVSKEGRGIPFSPGQYNMVYHYGFGEAAISISGDPDSSDRLIHTVRAVGSVTKGLQKLKKGDEVGIRGPFGVEWPLIDKEHVLVIAGGIGLAPLRPALYRLASRKNVTLLYGARNPDDIIYKSDLKKWKELGMSVKETLDKADVSWQGQVGVVTRMIKGSIVDPKNTLVLICGPEIMIRFSIHELLGAHVDEKNIFMSLERHMQCSTGFCGLCQYGPYFLCKDGPIFSYEKINEWFAIKEL